MVVLFGKLTNSLWFFILLHIQYLINSQENLNLVIEICRHGSRGQLYTMFDSTWPADQMNELTSVGMREHFVLGQQLAQRYPKILASPYNPKTIYIESTDQSRAIASAVSQLSGIFYEAGANLTTIQEQNAENLLPYKLNKEYPDENITTNAALPFNYYVLPIHSNNLSNTILLPMECPNSASGDATNTSFYNNFVEYMNPTITYLKEWYAQKLNLTGLTLSNFQWLGDTLYVNYYMNRTTPNFEDAVFSKVWNDTIFMCYAINFFSDLQTIQQRQTFSIPLLTQILSYMGNTINSESDLEFILLSGHDDTLLPILSALNITTPECLFNNYQNNITNDTLCVYPGFASQVIFELWGADGQWFVNGFYDSNPIWPTKYDGEYQLTFQEFNTILMNSMGNQTMNNYYAFCGNTPTNSSGTASTIIEEGNTKYVLYSMIGVCLVIFIAASMIFLKWEEERKLFNNVNSSFR